MNIDTNDRVVCIDDKFDDCIVHLFTALPIEGKVYVVRDVQIGFTPLTPHRRQRSGAAKLLLVGLVNPCADDGKEHGFNSDRFRRLDEAQAVNADTDTIPFQEQLTNLYGRQIDLKEAA